MSTAALRAAVHPDADPHGTAGRVMSIAFGEALDNRDRLRRAADELRAGLELYLRGGTTRTTGAAGALREETGAGSGEAAAEQLCGWAFLTSLASTEHRTVDQERDLTFGRYMLLGLGHELAFVVQSRAGTRALAAALSVDDEVPDPPGEAWTAAWRAVQRLARQLGAADLDAAAVALAAAGRADTAYARVLLDRLG